MQIITSHVRHQGNRIGPVYQPVCLSELVRPTLHSTITIQNYFVITDGHIHRRYQTYYLPATRSMKTAKQAVHIIIISLYIMSEQPSIDIILSIADCNEKLSKIKSSDV